MARLTERLLEQGKQQGVQEGEVSEVSVLSRLLARR